MIRKLQEENRQLKDEIARMKGGNQKPRIRPSNLEKNITRNGSRRRTGRRKQKKKPVEIEETIKVSPEAIPDGSRFKGYKTYRVAGVEIPIKQRKKTAYLILNSIFHKQ